MVYREILATGDCRCQQYQVQWGNQVGICIIYSMEKTESPTEFKRPEKEKSPSSKLEREHESREGNSDSKKRYKRCCIKCKHTEKGRRSCVCVVPLGQRRTEIGNNGCQTCGCNGCSIEDYVARGEDPQYKPEQNNNSYINDDFEARNGCCKQCMKAFSKSNKSCLCQVPREVRKSELPMSGCKVCHCNGCHPDDKREHSSSRSNDSRRRSRGTKKRFRDMSPSPSQPQTFLDSDYNLNNADRSSIGMVIAEAGLYAPLLGLGIPQRSYSYIIGRPQPK